jgi:hypothetical protein
VAPNDALMIINQINAGSDPDLTALGFYTTFLDVNGDDAIASSDALAVINFLNSNSHRGGGEAEGESIDAALSQADFSSAGFLEDDLLAMLATESATSKRRAIAGLGG